MDITIKPEFNTLIPALTEEEYNQLEQNIINDGCREPLVIWNDILIDGHHRYEICQKNNIPYSTSQLEFENQEDVEEWILLNHLGRRNLTTEAKTYLIGKLYAKKKKDKSVNLQQNIVISPNLPKGQNGTSVNVNATTSEELAGQFKLGQRTVKRAKEFSESIDRIRNNLGDEVKNKILNQQYKTTNKAVKFLANLAPEKQKAIINKMEEDKYNDLKKVIDRIKEEVDKRTVPYPSISDNSIIEAFVTKQKEGVEPVICPTFWNFKWANGCHYDCAWCFLKGTYRGKTEFRPKAWEKVIAHVLEFLNIVKTPQLLNAGELADGLGGETKDNSLALALLALFINSPHKILFLTKSNQVQHLLNAPDKWKEHAVLAWSLNAEAVAERWEKDAPSIKSRIEAAKKVFDAGFEVRIRIDPIVNIEGWQEKYSDLINQIFDNFAPSLITIGTLRMVNPMTKGFTWDKSWAEFLTENTGWGKKLPQEARIEIYAFIMDYLKETWDYTAIGVCKETESVIKELKLKPEKCNCLLSEVHD